MIRKLIGVVVVLAVLLVVGDRIAHGVAQRQIAERIQTSQRLATRPTVTLDGVPFLTQVLGGTYDGGRIVAENVQTSGVTLTRLDVTVRGVHVPFGDLVRRNVDRVPVDHVEGTGRIALPALAQALDVPDLTLTATDGQLRVSASVDTPLGRVAASGTAALSVAGGALRIGDVRLVPGLASIPDSVIAQAEKRLNKAVPIGSLPYGLRITSVHIGPAGIDVQAGADHTVLSQ